MADQATISNSNEQAFAKGKGKADPTQDMSMDEESESESENEIVSLQFTHPSTDFMLTLLACCQADNGVYPHYHPQAIHA